MWKLIHPGQKQGVFLIQQTLFPHLNLSCKEVSKAVSAIVISSYTNTISIISSNRKGKSTSENIYIGQQSSVPSIISTSQFLDSQDLKIRIRNTASISGVISTLQNKV